MPASKKRHNRLCINFVVLAIFCICYQLKAQGPDSLLTILKLTKEDLSKVKLLNAIANGYTDSNPANSLSYSSQALELAKNLGAEDEEVKSYGILARANIMMGHFKEGGLYYEKAEALYIKLKDLNGQANASNGKAVVYLYQEDYSRSLELFLKTLKLYERANNKNLAEVFANIGIVLAKLQRFEEAIQYFEKAICMLERSGKKTALTRMYCNLGALLQDKNEFDRALIYYNKALDIQKALGDSMLIVILRVNVGSILLSKEKYHEALLYNTENYELAKRLNDTNSIVKILNNIGSIHLALKNWNKSIGIYEMALSLTKDLQDKQVVKLIYQSLVKAYKEKKDYAMALKYQETFYTMDTAVFNSEVANRVEQLKEKYEAERREGDILLLEEQNSAAKAISEKQKLWIVLVCSLVVVLLLTLILIVAINRNRKRKKELAFIKTKAELEQTALLAQMNPHFIFNALNSIQHYILSKETEYAYDYLAKFGKLIRQVLINSEQNTIAINKEIETLKLYLELEQRRLKNRFDFEIRHSKDFPAHDITIPTMLIQPFVENAIWHGIMNLQEDKKGKLILDFNLVGKQLRISVEDNGVGRQEATLRKMNNEYKSVGVMFTQKRLELLKAVSKQQSEIIINDLIDERGHADGTRVEIVIDIIV